MRQNRLIMDQQYLLDGEDLITPVPNKNLVLTTYRLRHFPNGKGESDMVSIMLENIASIRVTYHSHIWILILGILLLVAWGLGLVLIIIYFLTRKHSLLVTSVGGDQMVVLTKGMSKNAILTFTSTVEQAICHRKKALH